MKYYVVTVATDRSKLITLERSCQEGNVPLTILGLNQKWTGFGMRFRLIREWLLNNPQIGDDDYIIHTDAYDSALQRDDKVIKEALEKLNIGDKVLVSAEVYLWPPEIFEYKEVFDSSFDDKYTGEGGYSYMKLRYKYPCAGQYVAKKKSLIKMIETINMPDAADDQAALINYIVNHPDNIYLDYDTVLFQPNLFLLHDHETAFEPRGVIVSQKKWHTYLNPHLYVFQDKDGKYYFKNRLTGNGACFLHANGANNEAIEKLFETYISPIENCNPRHFSNVFPAVEVVAMPNRKEYVNNLLKAQKINHNIFNAIIGKNLNDKILKDQGFYTLEALSDLTAGEKGCGMSHITLLLKYQNGKMPYLLVFEDDLSVSNWIEDGKWIGDHILEAVSISNKVEPNWDILYLGRCEDKCKKTGFYSNTQKIVRLSSPLCTHAYIVKTKSIPKILHYILPMNDPIDHALKELIIAEKIIAVGCNPALFTQSGFVTSITGRKSIVQASSNITVPRLCRDLSEEFWDKPLSSSHTHYYLVGVSVVIILIFVLVFLIILYNK